MSRTSSSAADWFSQLTPARLPEGEGFPRRPDDPRLGETIEIWKGDSAPPLHPGRPVLVGYPQDEGICRNHGRPGAAAAPREIRRWLHLLTPWDATTGVDLAENPLLDVGDLKLEGDLEQTQADLARVVAGILAAGAVPIVLGGGHETAYGHYLGYVACRKQVGILNIDAHLDIRPCPDSRGHSGSSFRQAIEYPPAPLPGERYACLGAQPQAAARDHVDWARSRGVVIRWVDEVRDDLEDNVDRAITHLSASGGAVYVTVDADAVHLADVPGVSAPNPNGLAGRQLLDCARRLGRSPKVSSFDLVEIAPPFDRDAQSARWGALIVWNFLVGLCLRARD